MRLQVHIVNSIPGGDFPCAKLPNALGEPIKNAKGYIPNPILHLMRKKNLPMGSASKTG